MMFCWSRRCLSSSWPTFTNTVYTWNLFLSAWLREDGQQTCSLLCRKAYAICSRRELDQHTRSRDRQKGERKPQLVWVSFQFLKQWFLKVSLSCSSNFPNTGLNELPFPFSFYVCIHREKSREAYSQHCPLHDPYETMVKAPQLRMGYTIGFCHHS